jgi:hypothetical protein
MPLKILPLPFKCPPIREATAWHHHRDQDLGLAWLRHLLRITAEELDRSAAGQQLARHGEAGSRPI